MVPAAVMYQPARQEVQPYFDRLLPVCKEYTATISERQMTLAVETCAYVWWLCDRMEPEAVCDLGSGFSSYVLRMYQCEHPGVVVHSVDDSRHWLKQTALFLAAHDLPTGCLLTGDYWLGLDDRYGLIVHDYSGGDTREEWMWHAADRLTLEGVVVFDDAHHRAHHMHMGRVARERGRLLVDVYEQTVDESGRFAALAVPA